MIMLTLNILMFVTYTSIVVTAVYLIIYSNMYSWWKNSMGLVMNLSIVSVGVIAVGVASRFFSFQTGNIIAIVGWCIYTGLLTWRLRLLIDSAKTRRKEQDNHHHPPSGN